MTEVSERVGATCPSCSPDVPTAHEVLAQGGQWTVRCGECGHVHKTRIDDELVERDVVVSQDGESFTASVEVPPDEPLAEGDEFVLDATEGVFTVRITSLQVGTEERTDAAAAGDVDTIWTRDVGNVAVPTTVHPATGARDETRSVELHVPGDEEFVVGESHSVGDEEFEVEGIALRDRAVGYEFDDLDHEGDVATAKDIKRLYVREAGPALEAWSAW
ncbi:hypothetical protein BRD00_00480 [Halobacteriales archaeon QS_8_69_26]|nr:MAG: hypothetical protein BRD00_00480 [Halobacteriales archaeon QS_8_69_26]